MISARLDLIVPGLKRVIFDPKSPIRVGLVLPACVRAFLMVSVSEALGFKDLSVQKQASSYCRQSQDEPGPG